MSTSLIIGLAFLVSFVLSYKLLKKVIKNALNNKRNKSKFSSEETEKFRKDMLEYYKKSSEKYKELDAEVNKMMNEALDKANSIIKHNRQQLDQTLDDNAHSNLKKVTDQVEKALGDLQANTANIAADAVKKIMHERKDDKRSSEVISSFSRDLNKKIALGLMQQLPILQADNVEKIKFDSSLCKEPEKLFYYKFNMIPWQKLNDTTFFMVEDTSRDINRWVEAHYGIDYVLIKVDSEQILNLLNSHFGISEFASNYLYYKNANFSAKSIKLSSIFFASFFIVTSILTLTEKYTYFALMLIFIIGCSNYLFKFIATIFNLCETSNQKVDYSKLNEPIYTILLPVFEESAVIGQLIESVKSLDYPKSKLDVKLLVESEDQETLAAIEKYTLPQYFEVIKVPHSLPRTKAKSCNYAMSFARGKYAVIYDADDKPDPLQLKKALIEFNKGDDKLACVQAKLNYYNCDYNFLTKSFSLEYMNWFQYLLPGFQKMNMPMPLGGSSNHFSVKILKKLFFWDAYSVTEDADLGLRLAQTGYKTRMIDSETLEESPIAVFA